ncbi:MAG: response regulator, partial [Nitrospirae bacterium]|nr:response regulator [Nitrospirota bacterium]
ISSADEIGTLALAFKGMNGVLESVGNSFTQMISNLRELTNRLEERVEERTSELRESERKFSDIISFLPDATIVIDREGRVLAWNKATETLTGIKADDIIGKGDYEYALPFYGERRRILVDFALMNPEELERGGYANIRMTGETLVGEIYAPNLPGGRRYLLGTARPLHDSRGDITGAIEQIHDITDRHLAEEALAKAKEIAEDATRVKSDFLANMSHELRTPMNAIIGYSEMLVEDAEEIGQRKFVADLNKINFAGKHLLGLINDILDFSKIEAGKLHFECVDFSLEDVMSHLADIAVIKAQDKGLKLLFDVGTDVPAALRGDPLRLGQILINLVNNAVKFTEDGEITVGIKCLADGPDGVSLRFDVADTGIGLTEAQRSKLFTAFTQADSSTSRKYGGTGLGLTISKRLVEMMGGEIGVDSEPGVGSDFHFTAKFPLQAEQRRFDTSADGILNALGKDAVRWTSGQQKQEDYKKAEKLVNGSCLLLVEDNAVNQEVALKILQDAGIGVDIAQNGAEAIEKVRQKDYDGVLMDCQMPVMDGFEATRRIRQDMHFTGLPIIAMTANAMAGDREKCIECGMNDHVAKPIDVGRLFMTLARWVKPKAPPVEITAREEKEDVLPNVQGVELEKALRRTGGNTRLLRTMFSRFCETQADVMERIRTALVNEDAETAAREAHMLKGLAGNIGADIMFSLAGKLEGMIKDGEGDGLPRAMEDAGLELRDLLKRISEGMAQGADAETKVGDNAALDMEILASDLRRLADLLADDDSQAVVVMEGVMDKLKSAGQGEAARKVHASVSKFDFEEALPRLKELGQTLGVEF